MHRRKRSFAIFLFPIVAVATITALLLLRPATVRDAAGAHAAVTFNPVVSTAALPLPQTLPVDAPRSGAIETLARTRVAPERPRQLPERSRRLPVQQSAHGNDRPPGALPPAAVSLHAPLLPARDEMAGLDATTLDAATGSGPFRAASGRTTTAPTAAASAGTAGTHTARFRTPQDAAPRAWPLTPALERMLDAGIPTADGGQLSQGQAWIAEVRAVLDQLRQYNALGDREAGGTLGRLQRLTAEGLADAEALGDRTAQVAWLRVGHALERRLAVWMAVWQTTRRPDTPYVAATGRFAVDTSEVRRRAAVVEQFCEQTGDAEAWRYYLLLDRLADPAMPSDAPRRRLTAQRFLSRIQWSGLTAEQRRWLREPEVEDLAAALRPWAAGPVDYTRLLEQLERQESDALDLASIDVAATSQTLRFAAGSHPQQVAEAINTYYRNANLRLAVSQDLLNRLLPDPPPRTVPVSQSILGTQIHGTSEVASEVQIRLVPAADRWNLQVLTDGQIQAETTGLNGPVTVRNHSEAAFRASTELHVTDRGVRLLPSQTDVSQQTFLRGLHTRYDDFPLIGSLVRGIAMSKYHEARSRSKHISEARMRRQIAANVDEELETQIGEKSQRLAEQLLGPLARLRLAPTVVDLQTDTQRLTARYRLAGDWQLAAFTPRPRAMSDSLLSVQVHQSALNNTLERLVPSAEPQSIRTVAEDLVDMFGGDVSRLPADLPEDVYLQFSRTRPVTTEIEDDRLWLTFRVLRLEREGGLNLRHFIVRACYRGERQGLEARFVREGHLSIKGPRMSMGARVAVRAIFNKILNEDRPLPLTTPKLSEHPGLAGTEISQLELRDGWLGLALAPAQ
ncbi:hypothetical protein [Roseimaritima sediminicola]|uniref:hypothetical protein n=1 Tax=Roseimaritima sediminicola TaxID=2662066 RepID=UPI001298547E|nr:hypothetical protein [Roseimaritima sediminicola]